MNNFDLLRLSLSREFWRRDWASHFIKYQNGAYNVDSEKCNGPYSFAQQKIRI